MASWRSTMAPPSARTAVSPLAVATGCFSAAIRAAKRLRCCEASSRLATAAVLSPSPGSATCCPEFQRTPSRGLVNYCPTAGNRSLVQPRSELRLYHSIHATGMRFTSRLRLSDWFLCAQAAILGIRTAGATNTIFIPGMAYANASSFTSNGSSTAWLTLNDPEANIAVTVHCYTGLGSASQTVLSDACSALVVWARNNGLKVNIGEIAID